MNSIWIIVILKLHAGSKLVLKFFETPLNMFKIIDLSSSLVFFLYLRIWVLKSVVLSGDKIKKSHGAKLDEMKGYKEQQ